MTKEEAKQALKDGKMLTHRLFIDSEWCIESVSDNTIIFEDGCTISSKKFWKDRTSSEWDNDWEEFDNIRLYTKKEHIEGIKKMINLYTTTYVDGDIDKWIFDNLQ